MSDGMSALDERINKFQDLLEEMRQETREAHSTLKQVRNEKREIQQILLAKDVQKLVDDRLKEVVERELEKIGPDLRNQSRKIYDRVGKQVDILINLSLGKEFSVRNGREDLRPKLAAKLREWIQEIIDET